MQIFYFYKKSSVPLSYIKKKKKKKYYSKCVLLSDKKRLGITAYVTRITTSSSDSGILRFVAAEIYVRALTFL